MTTHRLSFTSAELAEANQVRVPVRAGNTQCMPGAFEDVDLDSGRGRTPGRGPSSEIRARNGKLGRVVTLTPRYRPGHHVLVTTAGSKKPPELFRVVSVHGRRIRDIRTPERFNIEGWVARHGAVLLALNPWCWCLHLRKVR